MNKKIYTPRNLGIMSIFVSLGIILQYVENTILFTPVPGGKLGLSNIVSVINIFLFGGPNALVVSMLRAFLGTMLTGGVSALPYSLAGAFVSTISMWGAKHFFYPGLSMVGISVIGACLHNVSQIFVASIVFSSGYIFSYMPILLVVGVICGFVTGVFARIFGNRFLKRKDIL
ncbi:MAG: Gx transporter family protein [Clostridia bacterium]|nr:Gx transporter family protein [Clostridia bacterium]